MAALAAALSLCLLPGARAQGDGPPPQGTSRGENFSAKPPAQLFASDCTGAGCHKSPQGLNKGQGFGGLAGFLREHYTNSRESAAALAAYLSKLPSGPEPKEARTPRSGKPTAAAPASVPAGWDEGVGPSRTREREPSAKPAPNEARTSRQTPAGRTSRAAVRPDEEPVASPAAAEPAESSVKPDEVAGKPNSTARAQRVRHPAGATAAAPSPPPEPEAAPAAAPASPPPPPAPKEFDIFD